MKCVRGHYYSTTCVECQRHKLELAEVRLERVALKRDEARKRWTTLSQLSSAVQEEVLRLKGIVKEMSALS